MSSFGYGYSDPPPQYGMPVRLYDTFKPDDSKNSYTGHEKIPNEDVPFYLRRPTLDPTGESEEKTLSALDIVKGGYRYYLARKAVTSKHVDIQGTLDALGYEEFIKKEALFKKLSDGTDNVYNKLADERAERKARAYKPQGAIYGIQKGQYAGVPESGFMDSIGQTDPELVGTMYLRSNIPDKINTFPNNNLIVGRGRMVPTVEPRPDPNRFFMNPSGIR